MEDGPAKNIGGRDHPRAVSARARSDRPRRQDHEEGDDGHAKQEDALPPESAHERAADERAQAEPDTEPGARPAQAPAVARGGQRQRHERGRGAVEEAAGCSLEHAEDEEDGEGRHQRVAREAQKREHEAGAHHAPRPQPIGEHARGERGQRVRPHVADDDPANGGRTDAEGRRHGGKCDVDGAVEPDEQEGRCRQEHRHGVEYTAPPRGGRAPLVPGSASCRYHHEPLVYSPQWSDNRAWLSPSPSSRS